jgi:hypothetical protein
MKCRGYNFGVWWIAANEEIGRNALPDDEVVVRLLAALFGVAPIQVVNDVGELEEKAQRAAEKARQAKKRNELLTDRIAVRKSRRRAKR